MLCLLVHYGWYLGLVFSHLSVAKGLLFVLMTQMICGFLLSIVFVQSHNGMEVYSSEKDFVTAQVISTRDIAPGLWNDWFTGEYGLSTLSCMCQMLSASVTTVYLNYTKVCIQLMHNHGQAQLVESHHAFAGGLNYQIEHHLFPTLPRHNLGKVQQKVQELCEKHGLHYENCGMAVGTVRVLQRLADVASHA